MWLRGFAACRVGRSDFAIVIPGDLAKRNLKEKARKICQVRNHDVFHERESCGRFGSGEHLAERDWVIGSEVQKVFRKSHNPHGVGKRLIKSSPGGVVDKTQSHSQGGRTQDLRIFRPNKSSGFCLAQRLNSAQVAGALCTCWPTKNDGL
jgi:hypothetical protein